MLQELLFKSDDGETVKANALQIIYAMKLITDLEGLEDITEEELIETIQTPDRVLDEINFESLPSIEEKERYISSK